ncbi:MAG: M1 family metallopeptidase, partial [Acidobacteria bacterium]|nr:M1 family metallopeptidase [Acidobacteriota bacterium]
MPIQDRLTHPALLDPRQWGAVDLYDTTLKLEREALQGEEQFTPARPFAVQHLKLDLRFDDEAETVSGSAHITVKPMDDDFVALTLDAAEFDVRSVTLIHHDSPKQNCAYEIFPEKLAIELPRTYTRHDQLTLEIVYSCQPRKGLYFIKPDEAYPHKPRQIWSQGQNEDAHWWFPCHDVTNQKMTTELIAEVRENFFALSNGKLLSVTENPTARTKTYHWSQEQPHPSYLVTIVIGEYEKLSAQHGALPVDYYVYRARQDAGHKLFARTPEMIALLEQRFGVPYPYDKYAQILVDDFLFGAMENTSASTFTDRCLLDERAALDVNYEDIVAHELAHHWFGDLVTCKDWTQIWVNESFATYSEYLWREATRGTDDARFALFQDFLLYLREDLNSHRRPLLFHRYRFSEELMDRHAYEKGACTLDM